MSRANDFVNFVPAEHAPNGYPQHGLTIREYAAIEFAKAIITGPGSREGVPGNEWFDAPAMGLQIADRFIAELSKPSNDGSAK
jgi:hypothetical protein